MLRRPLVLAFILVVVIAAALALLLLLSGFDLRGLFRAAATYTPTASATATASPTATLTPTPTSTPTPTLIPTATPVSQFGQIIFTSDLPVSGKPVNPRMTFVAGTQVVYALWDYQNMRDGMPVKLCWVLDGNAWSCNSITWSASLYGASGQGYMTTISERGGLPAGNWRLELYIEDRQVQFASFAIYAPTPSPTLVPTPMPPATPLPPPGDGYRGMRLVVLGVNKLNLRSAPDLTQDNVIAQMPLGTVVEVLQAPKWDGERLWYNVRVLNTGQTGWAGEFYLATTAVADAPILFCSARSGNEDIYRIRPDGTGLKQLTYAPGNEIDPSWSRDRSRIAFAYGTEKHDLYTMTGNGENWTQLTSDPADEVHPVWSPDGTRIAYVSDRDGDWELYVLELATRQVRQLTFNNAWDSFPSWSQDGTRLVFTSMLTGNYDLFVVDVNTTQLTQLTTSPYSDAHGSWSPVGDDIVYTRVVVEGDTLARELGMLSVRDPAHPRRVTESDTPAEALYQYPDWSPDGKFIVFTYGNSSSAEVYVMPARGGTYKVSLTQAFGAATTAPTWSR